MNDDVIAAAGATTPRMNPEIKQRWVQALRSGEYEQGRGSLRDSSNQYCCLGVLCEIAVADGVIAPATQRFAGDPYTYGGETGTPPIQVASWAGLDRTNPRVDPAGNGKRTAALSTLNDGDEMTFEEIANIIEEQL